MITHPAAQLPGGVQYLPRVASGTGRKPKSEADSGDDENEDRWSFEGGSAEEGRQHRISRQLAYGREAADMSEEAVKRTKEVQYVGSAAGSRTP